MPKVIVKWSKKEQDWLAIWPDNAGKKMSFILFDMIRTTGHRTDWEKDLKTLLTERGYDYRTFKITVEKIKEPVDRKEHE